MWKGIFFCFKLKNPVNDLNSIWNGAKNILVAGDFFFSVFMHKHEIDSHSFPTSQNPLKVRRFFFCVFARKHFEIWASATCVICSWLSFFSSRWPHIRKKNQQSKANTMHKHTVCHCVCVFFCSVHCHIVMERQFLLSQWILIECCLYNGGHSYTKWCETLLIKCFKFAGKQQKIK